MKHKFNATVRHDSLPGWFGRHGRTFQRPDRLDERAKIQRYRMLPVNQLRHRFHPSGLRSGLLLLRPADAILTAREFPRDRYWPLRAAGQLRQLVSWPVQHLRVAPSDAQAHFPVNLDKLKSCFEEEHAIPDQR
jgi:hypothetical protein